MKFSDVVNNRFVRVVPTVLFVLAAVVVLAIQAWPNKSGDIKVDADYQPRVYWRGPDAGKPGQWLPLTKKLRADVNDIIFLNGDRVLLHFGDDTAAVVTRAHLMAILAVGCKAQPDRGQ